MQRDDVVLHLFIKSIYNFTHTINSGGPKIPSIFKTRTQTPKKPPFGTRKKLFDNFWDGEVGSERDKVHTPCC